MTTQTPVPSLVPNPSSLSDAEVKSRVEMELEWTPSVDNAHIGVSVTDGAVTLSGEVESYPEKMRAEHAALQVHGVIAVAQEISVHSTWGPVNDTDIAREATAALEKAVDVPANSVHVSVHHQHIQLSGAVAWQFQREAAARSVQYLRGVHGLDNTITVSPVLAAVGVKDAIEHALERHAHLEAKRVTVATDGRGNVTLDGTARSWAEFYQIGGAAWSAPGVVTVLNHIRVTY